MVHISFESIWLTRVTQDDFTEETPAGETLPSSLHPPEGFYIILLSPPEVGGEKRKYLLTLVTTATLYWYCKSRICRFTILLL